MEETSKTNETAQLGIGGVSISALTEILKSDSVYTILRYGVKSPSSSAKNKSIERFNHRTGYSNNTDIHGLLWDERVLLDVGTIDLDTRRCELTNPFNGFTWIGKLDNIVLCNSDGSPRRHSER